jgi:hypothetical protein
VLIVHWPHPQGRQACRPAASSPLRSIW